MAIPSVISRRASLALIASAAVLALPAQAQQDYPTRAITIVVPFTAGGPTDFLARLMAQDMAKDLGRPVVVENVAGAGGAIAQARVARAQPDGYTLLVGNIGTMAVTGALNDKLSYKMPDDFVAIASLGDATQVLSVKAALPVSNLDEFAAYAKANQEKMNYGTGGVGSGAHLGGILLNAALGINVQPVHYRGGINAIQDVMAGTIDFMVESSSVAVSSIASGKVKGVAVLRKDRVPALPNLQASGESGFPQLLYSIWNMMAAPKGTPPAVLARLNASVNKVLAEPHVLAKYAELGLSVPTAAHRSLAGSGQLLASENVRWKALIDKSGAASSAKN